MRTVSSRCRAQWGRRESALYSLAQDLEESVPCICLPEGVNKTGLCFLKWRFSWGGGKGKPGELSSDSSMGWMGINSLRLVCSGLTPSTGDAQSPPELLGSLFFLVHASQEEIWRHSWGFHVISPTSPLEKNIKVCIKYSAACNETMCEGKLALMC